MKARVIGLVAACVLAGCEQSASPWHLMLSHTRDGDVQSGSASNIVSAVRQGCQLRVAWGTARRDDPSRTIEHMAAPEWVVVRNGEDVEIQIGGLINHGVLGEPIEDHPRSERFGGTDKVVKWRAKLKTDGTFDAIWFHPHNGEFIIRVPQRHSMKWFADCKARQDVSPLYPMFEKAS